MSYTELIGRMNLRFQDVSLRASTACTSMLSRAGLIPAGFIVSLVFWTASAEDFKTRRFPETCSKVSIFGSSIPSGLTEFQLRFIAEHLAGGEGLAASDVATIRRTSPEFINLHDRLAVTAGPKPYFMGDAWSSDWDWVAQHPDWFVRSDDGWPIRHLVEGGYLMDPSGDLSGSEAEGWKEYWAGTVIHQMRKMGADGVLAKGYNAASVLAPFLDAADPRFDESRVRDTWLPHLNRFGRYVKGRFAATPEDFLFVADGDSLAYTWDRPDFGVADGVLVSNFAGWDAVDNAGNWSNWKRQMNGLLALGQMNKAILCRSYLADPADSAGRLFRFGSYLLIKATHTFFYLQRGRSISLEYYPEYEVNLGRHVTAPSLDVESFFRKDWGVYVREYQNGLVLLNPTDNPGSVRLDRPYLRLTAEGGGLVDESGNYNGAIGYQVVQSLSMGPYSAAILLRTNVILPSLPILQARSAPTVPQAPHEGASMPVAAATGKR